MALTDTKLRNLRRRPTLYRVADTSGLCIEVTPAGSKLWRYRYRWQGKASMLPLGDYPTVTLAAARRARDDARALLNAGTNPAEARRAEKRARLLSAENTFAAVAKEWLAKQSAKWTPHHAADVLRSLEQEAFPAFGPRPVSELEPPEILACLKRIEARGALEIAHCTAHYCRLPVCGSDRPRPAQPCCRPARHHRHAQGKAHGRHAARRNAHFLGQAASLRRQPSDSVGAAIVGPVLRSHHGANRRTLAGSRLRQGRMAHPCRADEDARGTRGAAFRTGHCDPA